MDAATLTLILLGADTATTILVATLYLAPRVRRTEARIESKVMTTLAAAAGMRTPIPDNWTPEEFGAAIRAHVASETRSAIRAEAPAMIAALAPEIEARVRAAMPELGAQVRAEIAEAMPGLITELAPTIGDAIISAGQSHFRNKSLIEQGAAHVATSQMPGAQTVDLAAIVNDPRIQAVAAEKGIDLPALLADPQVGSFIKKPQRVSAIARIAKMFPGGEQLYGLWQAWTEIKPLLGMVGSGGFGGGGGTPPAGVPQAGGLSQDVYLQAVMRR